MNNSNQKSQTMKAETLQVTVTISEYDIKSDRLIEVKRTIPVTIGETYVGFKYDVEQTGLVTGYRRRNGKLLLTVIASEGGYVQGPTPIEVEADEIW